MPLQNQQQLGRNDRDFLCGLEHAAFERSALLLYFCAAECHVDSHPLVHCLGNCSGLVVKRDNCPARQITHSTLTQL
jgi:hypothetical protein